MTDTEPDDDFLTEAVLGLLVIAVFAVVSFGAVWLS